MPTEERGFGPLSVDLGTDIPLGIALAWEEPETAIMKQPPRKATDRLTNWRLFVLAYFQLGILESLYCFTWDSTMLLF